MNLSTNSNAESAQEMGPYERKWKSLFEENFQLFVDEELDYEYNDEDYQAVEDLPLTYNWSPSSSDSSPSSTRSNSPTRIINLTDDDDDEYSLVQKSLKKLTREFSRIYNFKRNSISPATRKNWKKYIDIKGVLKRWRIRSLDTIFVRSTQNLPVARIPQRVVNIQTPGIRVRPESEIAEVAIVFDNDLCANNQEGEPIPNLSRLPPLRRISVIHDNSNQHSDAPPQLDRFDQVEEGPSSGSGNLVDFLPEKYSVNTETQYMAFRNNNASGLLRAQLQKRVVNSSTLQRFMNLQTPLSAPPNQEHLLQRHNFLSNINATRDAFAASRMTYTHYPYPPPPPLHFPLSLPASYRMPYSPHPPNYPRSNNDNNVENEYQSRSH